MNSLRVVRSRLSLHVTLHIRKCSVIPGTNTTNEVEYPQILDWSYLAKKKRAKEKEYDFVKRQETVEEKLMAINMPKYYGWKSILMEESKVPYNALEQAQYVTRTHIVPDRQLPSFYNDVISSEALEEVLQNVRSCIKDALVFEYSNRKRNQELTPEQQSSPDVVLNKQATAVTRQINRIFLAELSSKYPHLLEVEVDYDPRVEAFWFVGGIIPPEHTRLSKLRTPWLKEYAENPVDRTIQYLGAPNLQLRHRLPLKEVVSFQESESPSYKVPVFKYDPRGVGYFHTRRHGTNIPGFWPGDQSEFGLLSYHNCGYIATRNRSWDDEEDALKTQAVRAAFSWLHSQACYQGFSTFNDLMYPLTTQTIITNGQWWFFCVYQLNAMLLSENHVDDNPKRNLCWMTGPLQLFERIENGKVHGLNDEVLKHIIKFYVNVPQGRGIEMKPFLGKDVKLVADIEDQERRTWLETRFKYLMSCRPRHKLMPEIYNWQQIYMRRHKLRPFEKKLEPWQLGINVAMRRLDDHTPQYIPKCKRPYPKARKKFENTYYPKYAVN